MEIVEDLDGKSYSNNGKPWKSSRILRVKPIVFISLDFSSFCYFSSFLLLFPFCFFFFFFFSFVLIFFSLSFLLVGGSKSDFFLGPNFVKISLHISFKKNFKFSARLGVYPFFSSFF